MTTCEDIPYNVLTMRLLEALDAKKECTKVEKYTHSIDFRTSGVVFYIGTHAITLAAYRSSNGSIHYHIEIKNEHYPVKYIDGELMLKSLIDWYQNKVNKRKEDNKKQLLMDTISLVENYEE